MCGVRLNHQIVREGKESISSVKNVEVLVEKQQTIFRSQFSVPDFTAAIRIPTVWMKKNERRTERKERQSFLQVRFVTDCWLSISAHVWKRLTNSDSQRPTNEPCADHLQSQPELDRAWILWSAWLWKQNSSGLLHGSAFRVTEAWGSPYIRYWSSCSRSSPLG